MPLSKVQDRLLNLLHQAVPFRSKVTKSETSLGCFDLVDEATGGLMRRFRARGLLGPATGGDSKRKSFIGFGCTGGTTIATKNQLTSHITISEKGDTHLPPIYTSACPEYIFRRPSPIDRCITRMTWHIGCTRMEGRQLSPLKTIRHRNNKKPIKTHAPRHKSCRPTSMSLPSSCASDPIFRGSGHSL